MKLSHVFISQITASGVLGVISAALAGFLYYLWSRGSVMTLSDLIISLAPHLQFNFDYNKEFFKGLRVVMAHEPSTTVYLSI